MHFFANTLFFNSLTLCFIYAKNYDICSHEENKNLCQIKEIQSTVICAGGFQQEYQQYMIHTNSSSVARLSLCYWPDEEFDPLNILLSFPSIEKFTLSKSVVKKISKDFPELIALKELNISHCAIEYFETTTFSKLTFLNVLDLRYNKLRFFDPSIIMNLNHLKNVYLVGNNYHCGDNFLWITSENNTFIKQIMDVDQLTCGSSKYNGKPLKRIMLIIETLKADCCRELPKNCTCVLEHVIRVGNNLRPMITVNCSNQNLKMLPPRLPNFTSTLIVRGNMISNLSEFITNKSYLQLLNAYMDYNKISSINTLAVSPWLLTFRALSLKGNNISEVPIYALENTFQKNHNVGKFLLSENPWKCNCMFTPVFKDFLVKYRSIIKDAMHVKCEFKFNDKNSLLPIFSLSRNKVCVENTTYGISFLNLLSIFFAISLLLLLGDFARNYYRYKKYGKLPWLANFIP